MPSAKPIYQQIMDDIREKVKTGELRPGERLPSLTQMAVLYRCSGEPVKTAVRMLSMTGELVGRQGLGIFVATREPSQNQRARPL